MIEWKAKACGPARPCGFGDREVEQERGLLSAKKPPRGPLSWDLVENTMEVNDWLQSGDDNEGRFIRKTLVL